MNHPFKLAIYAIAIFAVLAYCAYSFFGDRFHAYQSERTDTKYHMLLRALRAKDSLLSVKRDTIYIERERLDTVIHKQTKLLRIYKDRWLTKKDTVLVYENALEDTNELLTERVAIGDSLISNYEGAVATKDARISVLTKQVTHTRFRAIKAECKRSGVPWTKIRFGRDRKCEQAKQAGE